MTVSRRRRLSLSSRGEGLIARHDGSDAVPIGVGLRSLGTANCRGHGRCRSVFANGQLAFLKILGELLEAGEDWLVAALVGAMGLREIVNFRI